MLKEDVQSAIEHGSESVSVEYKSTFDPSSNADWVEIVKDIVALANSGGGVIIFGIDDTGNVSGIDPNLLTRIDPAALTDKISKYTGQQFAGFELLSTTKETKSLFVILVHGVASPLVFAKPGTYDIGGGRQKSAFAAGTVYFRHGAKSEPGNVDDLRWFLERRIEEIRRSWLDGIVKVVEAPFGSQVQILTPTTGDMPSVMRLVNDPAAPAFYQVPVDQTHPFRQKEVVTEVNNALKGTKIIKPFHVQCVRQAHNIDNEPTFCYRQKFASARYSKAFVDWIIERYNADPSFFEIAKEKADEIRRGVPSA